MELMFVGRAFNEPIQPVVCIDIFTAFHLVDLKARVSFVEYPRVNRLSITAFVKKGILLSFIWQEQRFHQNHLARRFIQPTFTDNTSS